MPTKFHGPKRTKNVAPLSRAELHIHFDGAVRFSTIWELCKEKGLPLPGFNPLFTCLLVYLFTCCSIINMFRTWHYRGFKVGCSNVWTFRPGRHGVQNNVFNTMRTRKKMFKIYPVQGYKQNWGPIDDIKSLKIPIIELQQFFIEFEFTILLYLFGSPE